MTDEEPGSMQAAASQIAALREQVAAQAARADAAMAAQAAMADILQLIGTTGVDTGPVLDRIVEACERLFPSLVVSVFLVDASGRIDLRCMHFTAAGRAWHDEAQRAQILATVRAIYPMPLSDTVAEMAFARGSVVDFGDVTQDPDAPASLRIGAQRLGMRYAVLTAPLLWQGQGVGTIGMTRQLEHAYSATQGFSPQEHALVMGFASQAVIAIRNARLIQETQDALHTVQQRTAALDESLAYQTAIGNVLRVISESPADVTPVFQTILQTADRLFGAVIGAVLRYDGQQVHLMATEGWPQGALEDAQRLYPGPPDPTQMSGRVILSGQVQTIADTFADSAYDPQTSRAGQWRRMLGAPMLRDGRPIGALIIAWAEPGPSDRRQVELLQTFAEQAVIAVENARLINETREALEQQKASADILRVISHSPTEVQPVFDAIVSTAVSLLACDRAVMILCDARHFWAAAVATQAAGLAASVEGTRLPLDAALNFPSRAILSKSVLHLPDWNAIDDLPEHERHIRDVSGVRAGLMLPLLRDGACIGLLALVRVRPGGFSDKEIALAQSFCDQAMIAIGNTRLFNETQQALERQTATANVLKAISRSTFDLPAVLETLITTAVRLSRAWIGVIFRIDGHLARPAGLFGGGQALYEHLTANPIDLRDPKALVSRAIALGQAVQVEDAADPDAVGRKDAQQAGGYRTLLAAPVLRDGVAIGVLTMARQEVQPFTQAEIDLVASFADQAAIAMENVRLFNETREALEQQTASAEVLQVIGSSVSDTQPVFERILSSAQRILSTNYVNIGLLGADGLVHLNMKADPQFPGDPLYPRAVEYLHRTFPLPLRESLHSYVAHKCRVFHYPDVLNDSEAPPALREANAWMGDHSELWVPLVWNGQGIGAFGIAPVSRSGLSATRRSR
jgi:GAF domain-containing protein